MSTACSSGLSALPGALYLHVPFCVRRCRYCDFSTSAIDRGDALVAAYVSALARVVSRLKAAGLFGGVRTAYVGGGTPSMAGEGLLDLVGEVRRACPGLEEFTSEANPESLHERMARGLAEAGLTRLSLGVQSLDDRELACLGRAHDAARAVEAARWVAGAGLDLSCDLMCGIPLQTPASWERSLAGVLEAGAGHVSCYPLILEEGTALWDAVEAGEVPEPNDDEQADYMLAAERVLGAAGMARYEVASYGLPGRVCRHNVAYWTGVPYLGLGPAASSMLDASGALALCEALPLVFFDAQAAGSAPMDPAAYLAERPWAARLRLRFAEDARSFVGAVERGAPMRVEVEALTAREAAAEDLMLGMRMSRGVGRDLLDKAVACGVPRAALDTAVDDVLARGLASFGPEGRLAPTERGWLLGNELYGAFWDLACD